MKTRGVLKLDTPLMVDNEPWEKVSYDFEKLTGMQYLQAMGASQAGMQELITEKQSFALFALAVCACHKELEIRDLERLDFKAVLLGAKMGRGFFTECYLSAPTAIGDE